MTSAHDEHGSLPRHDPRNLDLFPCPRCGRSGELEEVPPGATSIKPWIPVVVTVGAGEDASQQVHAFCGECAAELKSNEAMQQFVVDQLATRSAEPARERPANAAPPTM